MINYITGEKIQNLCGQYIGNIEDFTFNPNIHHQVSSCPEKFICFAQTVEIIKFIDKIDNKSKIFCYTHIFDKLDSLISLLEKFQNPFIIIAHNSDHCFLESHLILFNKVKNLKHIFVQNTNIINDKISPIPIGLANSQWMHGDLNTMTRTVEQHISKNNLVYFNFNISTNTIKRTECYNSVIKKISFSPTVDYHSYLNNLATFKFAICPEGNGIDCHRLWECLYLRVVPICKKNNLFEYYSTKYPIILLNEWNDLDLTILDKYYESIIWSDVNIPTIEYYNELFDIALT